MEKAHVVVQCSLFNELLPIASDDVNMVMGIAAVVVAVPIS